MFWWKRPGPASFKLGPQTSSYFYWKYGLGIGKISIGVDVVPGGHLYISLGMAETATDSTAHYHCHCTTLFLHEVLCSSYFPDLSPIRSLFFVLANFLKINYFVDPGAYLCHPAGWPCYFVGNKVFGWVQLDTRYFNNLILDTLPNTPRI